LAPAGERTASRSAIFSNEKSRLVRSSIRIAIAAISLNFLDEAFQNRWIEGRLPLGVSIL
jgi:hypothetical protein